MSPPLPGGENGQEITPASAAVRVPAYKRALFEWRSVSFFHSACEAVSGGVVLFGGMPGGVLPCWGTVDAIMIDCGRVEARRHSFEHFVCHFVVNSTGVPQVLQKGLWVSQRVVAVTLPDVNALRFHPLAEHSCTGASTAVVVASFENKIVPNWRALGYCVGNNPGLALIDFGLSSWAATIRTNGYRVFIGILIF